jgi:aromatic-L-amino-acid decarboxylase
VKAGSIPDAVIYMTEQVHHCVSKAVRIAGLAEAHVREVPMDERFRMSPTGLSGLIEQDRAAGLRPFLVVASAGTTDTGAIDPLESIAAVARDGGLWLHVDAAYGGFFLLSELVRDRLVGLRHADSIVLDPHKGLFLPYGSGAVLVRDGAALHRTNRYAANYMQDAESARDESSPAERSPELTRPFRGLRMWFPLQLFGLAPFRAALDEKVLLARYFQGRLREIPDMEVGPDPQLSVTIFRYRPKGRDPNEVNAELMRILHEDGRVFLSSTMIGGEFWIRLAVLHFRTHRTTIDRALEMISEGIRVLRG